MVKGGHSVYTTIVCTRPSGVFRPFGWRQEVLKNITLSADEELIALAREKASRQGTTVNSQFRLWLRAYIEQEQASRGYRELMRGLDYANPGRRFTRDELNTR